MGRSRFFPQQAIILTGKELQEMRLACRLAADTLEMIGEHIQPGITTDEINTLVHEYTLKHNAAPAPLGYGGTRTRPPFPKSVCTSVNNVVCHGIPDGTVLNDGDIVNVDVTSIYPAKRGYYGDTSATFYVGEPSPLAKHVVEVARESLEIGLQQVRPGGTIGDIGHAIQTFAESKGCAVVRDYTGHGIGRRFHGPPSVPHYGSPGIGPRLRKGMTFTIEPMINLRSHEVDHLDDGWTVITADGGYSAQFEHTIVVTASGVEVLTKRHTTLKNSEDKSWSKLGPLSCHMAE
ncbi:MAG: type I methionyl aminopeptidase [Myxococcota bacterium]|nr:type I methionyl aminopeptidase [Myxococcota bacterium]MEC8381038.1 type I methionyl aminopeptidase [Myxococcota bacterium]